MLVKDYYKGNTHIKIFDDCCVKTQAEVDAILARVGNIWYNSEVAKIESERAVKA